MTATDDIEIEIADDQPALVGNADVRGSDVARRTDDDSEHLGKKTQKRIGTLTKNWRDAERERDTERAEKARIAAENEELRRQLYARTNDSVEISAAHANDKVTAAEDELQRALEEGVASKISAATRKVATATAAAERATEMQQRVKSQPAPVQPQVQPNQPQRPQLSGRTQDWIKRNPWFSADAEANRLAMGAHQEALDSGYEPDSDDYFSHIENRVAEKRPDLFGEEGDEDVAVEQPAPRRSPVVAAVPRPVPRSGPGVKPRIRLTAEQVAMAKSLDMTAEEYGREMYKLQQENKLGPQAARRFG